MDTPKARKPFIDVVPEQTGEGFITGAVIGSAGYYAKGGVPAVRAKVPGLSGRCAAFFGLYSAVEHAMVTARRKEEPMLDSAVAASAAFAILSLPKGFRVVGGAAIYGFAFGGVCLGTMKVLQNRLDKLNSERNA